MVSCLRTEMLWRSVIVLAVCAPAISFANPSVALGMYRFSFDKYRTGDGSDYVPRSVVKIVRSYDRVAVFHEYSPLDPGCGKVSAISVLLDEYVVLCGHLGGRHYTYKVFRETGSGPSSATLDAFDDVAPLVVGQDGSITTLVARRDMFPEQLHGPYYFPHVYALRADGSSFGFSAVFGGSVRSQYESYYRWILEHQDPLEYLPVAVAALVATQDKGFICPEMKRLKDAGSVKSDKEQDVGAAIRGWVGRLPSIGYPSFDLDICFGDSYGKLP